MCTLVKTSTIMDGPYGVLEQLFSCDGINLQNTKTPLDLVQEMLPFGF